MKIFLSFLQGKPDYPIPTYSFWQFYIKHGIEESGIEWAELPNGDWARGLVHQSESELENWKQSIWEDTITYLKKHPVDLFLSYLYPHQVDVNSVKEIQKLGIPCVNFFCDNVREFKKVPKEFAVFDLNWVPEYKAIALYQKAAYRYIHLPMPMWVDPKNRVQNVNEINQVTFIGSRDIQRQLLFEEVAKKNENIPLCIYGSGWLNEENISKQKTEKKYNLIDKIQFQHQFIKRQGLLAYKRKIEQRNFNPPISKALSSYLKQKITFDEYTRLSKESMITVGVNRYPSFQFPLQEPDNYSRLRDIEAPMLGACYLSEWTAGLDQLYEIGEEIEVYHNVDELIEKIIELKRNPSKRIQLKVNGQKKALEEHSIRKTIEKIFSSLNIKTSKY